MNKLTLVEKMSSLQIAELTGKRHDNVIRDIRGLLSQGVSALNFEESYYLSSQNKETPCYELTKKGCLILASGYDAILREKIINRWEELEEQIRFNAPKTFAEALRLAADQQEQLEAKQRELEEKSNKIERLVHSGKLYTTTEIAKELNFKSAKSFNKTLEKDKIQYYINGTWVLHSQYADLGYTSVKQMMLENDKVIYDRKWTGDGRDFLLERFKNKGLELVLQKEEEA